MVDAHRSAEEIHDPPDRPPADIDPLYEQIAAGTFLRRIYAPRYFAHPEPHHVGPATFRRFGPLDRFDHHAPAIPAGPDADHGIYYAGVDLWDCAAEVFGSTRIIRLEGNRFAEMLITTDLVLVDLRGDGAMRIGSTAALAKGGPRETTQKWARYVHRNPKTFASSGRSVDGILYWNAHNDGRAVALFERAAETLECHSDQALSARTLHLALEHRARKYPGYVISE